VCCSALLFGVRFKLGTGSVAAGSGFIPVPEFLRQNCPTQAKIGFEWATRLSRQGLFLIARFSYSLNNVCTSVAKSVRCFAFPKAIAMNQEQPAMTHKQKQPTEKNSDSANKTAPPPRSLLARIRRQALAIFIPVGGTLILALQTYILHQQTLLLAKQTEATQLDQSAHLREHIVATSEEESSVKRLLSSLESVVSFEVDAEGGVLKVKDFSVNACLSPQCSSASLDQTLNSLGDDNPHLDNDVRTGILRIGAFLARFDGKVSSGLEGPHEIDMEKKADQLVGLRNLYTSGITQCFFDPGKARDLSESMARLRLISSSAVFISLPVAQPDKYREMVSKFPQVGSNTKMGLIQIQSSAADLMRVSGAVITTKDVGRTTYTFAEFVPVFAKSSLEAVAGLQELDKQCNATISRDATALKSMSVSSDR
jgi:hypothetical protein